MTLPTGIATVTVTGSEFGGSGDAKGNIEFRSQRVLYAELKHIGLATRYSGHLVDGALSIDLPVGGNPSDGTWHVTERVEGGSSYDVAILLANGPVQDLSALAPVTASTGTPVVVGPRGPAGWGVVFTDNPDSTFTLTTGDDVALVDNPDGTFTLTLDAA